MAHDEQVFSTEQCTNLYFHHVEMINNFVESFQMYSTHILNHPLSATEYRAKQLERVSYYKRTIRNIDVVLQMDQVYHIREGLPKVLSPMYVLTREELEKDNIKMILCTVHGDADIVDKEMQIIYKEFTTERVQD